MHFAASETTLVSAEGDSTCSQGISPGVDEVRAIVVTVELCLARPGHVKYCVHRAWRNGE